jgi:hypothetical protein
LLPDSEPEALFDEPAPETVPTIEEIDPADISDMDEPLAIQDMAYQADSDDEEDSSGFETGSSNSRIIWQCAVCQARALMSACAKPLTDWA